MSRLDDDGVEHAVWVLTNSDLLAAAGTALESKTFYLADGHHRYETALNYQRYRRGGLLPDTVAPAPLSSWQAVPHFDAYPAPGPSDPQSYDFAWVYAACMEDPGVLILPTHRCIHDVADFDADRLLAQLERRFEITPVPGDDALLDSAALGRTGTTTRLHWFCPAMRQASYCGCAKTSRRHGLAARRRSSRRGRRRRRRVAELWYWARCWVSAGSRVS